MEHTGKRWVGLAVAASKELGSLQKNVYDKLLALNIQSTTPSSTYFPHLTWARTTGAGPLSITSFPNQNFWHEAYSFAVSLGRTDENNFGIYRERLLPLPVRSRNVVKTTAASKKT
jgi:2'-5' RNA ligase